VDFSPPVIDLTARISLAGRTPRLSGESTRRRVDLQRQQHVINLLLWPAHHDAEGRGAHRRAPRLHAAALDDIWDDLLGDLEPDMPELRLFAHLVQQHAALTPSPKERWAGRRMACLLPRTPRIHVKTACTRVSSHDRLSMASHPGIFPQRLRLDERRYPYATHLPHDTDVRRLPSRSQAVATTSPTVSHRVAQPSTVSPTRRRHGRPGSGYSWWLQAICVLGLHGLGPEELVEVPLPLARVVFIGTREVRSGPAPMTLSWEQSHAKLPWRQERR